MPAVTPKPPAFQDSVVTVRDWDAVAISIAEEMTLRGLLPNPFNPLSASQPRSAYYIDLDAPDSAFLREVRQALRNEILHRGGTVTVSPVGAVVINLDVDVVRWNGHRTPGGRGTITGLTAGTGILLANAGPLSPAAGFGIATGAGMAADLLAAVTPRTNVEAVWQASAIMGDKLLFDIRRPLYIDAGDIPLHYSNTHLSEMSSPGAPLVAPLVRLRYDP
jgi:hypothetical protein